MNVNCKKVKNGDELMEEKRKHLFYDVVASIIHFSMAKKEGQQQLENNKRENVDFEIRAEEQRYHKENGTQPIPLYAYKQKIAVSELMLNEYKDMLGHFERDLQENPAIRELVEMFM